MSSEKSVTVRFRKYLLVETTSPEPIRPEDITIDIIPKTQQKNEVSQPNFLALCTLWAHFEACHQGLLQENKPAPWETFGNEKEDLWTQFLNHMVTDDNWPSWMTNSDEIKERSIMAYNILKITGNACTSETHDNGPDNTPCTNEKHDSGSTVTRETTVKAVLHRPITVLKTLYDSGKQFTQIMVRKITSRNHDGQDKR